MTQKDESDLFSVVNRMHETLVERAENYKFKPHIPAYVTSSELFDLHITHAKFQKLSSYHQQQIRVLLTFYGNGVGI